MGNLGMGVMIHMLFGGNADDVAAVRGAIGKTIASVELKDEALQFAFADGSTLKLWDDGQSCCESRYMRTDDNLADFVGATFTDLEMRDAPDATVGDGEPHEVQFLAVKTSKGEFVMSSHNEHNGYYGGFYIKASAGAPSTEGGVK
jgi:hypothetical protein